MSKLHVTRRTFLSGSAAAAAAIGMPAVHTARAAEDFPSRPVRLINPFSAGGAHDAHARAIASVAHEVMGQPILVELMPGATGAIASQHVANARPDGYTLLHGGPDCNSAVNQAQNLPYNKDSFVPILMINSSPHPIWVQPDAPFDDFQGFVDYAKANPGKLRYSSAGVWGLPHIPVEYMQMLLEIELTHVPYDGGGPALQGFLKGEVDINLSQITQSLPHYQAGKMVPIAVMDNVRHNALPDTPTTGELGYPDLVFLQWRGILAPAGTPPELARRLEDIFVQISENRSFVRIIERFGEQVNALRAKEFDEYWTAEYQRIGDVIRKVRG